MYPVDERYALVDFFLNGKQLILPAHLYLYLHFNC